MSKLIIPLSFLAVVVYSAPVGWPTAEEAKSEMLAAGISSQAVEGILNLASTFASQKPADGSSIDRDAARAAFIQFISQVEDYIKTKSPADQTAYTAFVAKKKADFEAHVASRQE